jgi:cytochrome c peroxidase
MYAALIPNFAQEDLLDEDGSQVWVWQGGHFHDGSARTLHEQISKPFFHPDEMNLASEKDLAARLRRAPYAAQLRRDMSAEAWADDALLAHRAYRALVAFLKEPLFRPFDACIDDFLAGKNDALTAQQIRGLELFRHKGKCADCHHLHASSWPQPLLSDYGYDNLGVPSRGAKDPGLAGHTKAPQELGHFRAPSLRNVALTAPYFHNGSIASLKEVVEFYNLRDKQPGRWGKTDYPGTVNHDDLGDLGLTEQEVDDLVSLMEAFTDRTLLRLRERGGTFPEQLPQTPDSWSMRAYFPDWTHDLPPLPAHPPYQGNLFPSTHSSHTP